MLAKSGQEIMAHQGHWVSRKDLKYLVDPDALVVLQTVCGLATVVNLGDEAFTLELSDQAPIGEILGLKLARLRHGGSQLLQSDTHQLRIGSRNSLMDAFIDFEDLLEHR